MNGNDFCEMSDENREEIELRAALKAGAPTPDDRRLRAALGAFRERLREHPAILRAERNLAHTERETSRRRCLAACWRWGLAGAGVAAAVIAGVILNSTPRQRMETPQGGVIPVACSQKSQDAADRRLILEALAQEEAAAQRLAIVATHAPRGSQSGATGVSMVAHTTGFKAPSRRIDIEELTSGTQNLLAIPSRPAPSPTPSPRATPGRTPAPPRIRLQETPRPRPLSKAQPPWRYPILLDPEDRTGEPYRPAPPHPSPVTPLPTPDLSLPALSGMRIIYGVESPDKQYLAALAFDEKHKEKVDVIIDRTTETVKRQSFGDLTPLKWLDRERVAWTNRSRHMTNNEPLKVIVSNVRTGEARDMSLE